MDVCVSLDLGFDTSVVFRLSYWLAALVVDRHLCRYRRQLSGVVSGGPPQFESLWVSK